MKNRTLFAFALFACASGCGSVGDPCAGHAGTCLALEVHGQGVSSVDQLRYQVSGLGGALLTGASPTTPGTPVDLPTVTAIYFDSGVSGSANLLVDGELGGAQVGSGSVLAAITDGGHAHAIVTLVGAGVDLAHENFDLAGADFAGDDLAEPAIDLAGADLTNPPPHFDLSGLDDGRPLDPDCPTAAVFCDNFEGENGAFPKWSGSMSLTDGAFQLDNTHPFLNGTESLEATGNGGAFALRKTFMPAFSSGTMAVRFYLYVAPGLASQASWLYFPDSAGNSILLGTTPSGAGWQLAASNIALAPTGQVTGAWQCVELDLNFFSSTVDLYVTDASTPQVLPPLLSVTLAGASYNSFYLGLYSSAGATDIWIDDVAVGTAHIGCE